MDGFAELAETNLRAFLDRRDVFDPHGGAVLARDDGSLDVSDCFHLTDGAHVDLLQSCLDEASAAVHVVVRELLFDLAQADAISDQLVRVDPHLHVGFIGDTLKLEPVEIDLRDIAGLKPVAAQRQRLVVRGQVGLGSTKKAFAWSTWTNAVRSVKTSVRSRSG